MMKYTDRDGRIWSKFTCSFTSPDGKYCFELWALSHDHALMQLESLKENAVVDGELADEIAA